MNKELQSKEPTHVDAEDSQALCKPIAIRHLKALLQILCESVELFAELDLVFGRLSAADLGLVFEVRGVVEQQETQNGSRDGPVIAIWSKEERIEESAHEL